MITPEIPSEVLSARVLRNLRDGDIVWVTVDPELDEEDMDTVHQIVSSLLPENVNLLVTVGGSMDLRVAALDELLDLQQQVEEAIKDFSAARAHDT